jgi:pimeloyl-ACP methyl ester carboxylesterase
VSNEEVLALKSELILQQLRLAEITVPVIAMQGDQDKLVSPANIDYIVRNLENAKLRIKNYPELNHFIPFSNRQLVLESILELSKAIENPASGNEIDPHD